MKQILVFIALAIFSCCLTACDKKPVDSEPDPELKHAYLTVATKDSSGYIFQ